MEFYLRKKTVKFEDNGCKHSDFSFVTQELVVVVVVIIKYADQILIVVLDLLLPHALSSPCQNVILPLWIV